MKITITCEIDEDRITDSSPIKTAIHWSVEKKIRIKPAAFTIIWVKVVLIGFVGYLEKNIYLGQLQFKKPSFW